MPVYESIDEDLYEKVREENMKEHETTGQNTRKKSRKNPVYDVGQNDDSLNPVINLAVTSPLKKTKKDGDFFPLEEDDSEDSLGAHRLSSFQGQKNPGNTYENVGIVNPLASDNGHGGEKDSKPPVAVKNEHEDSFETTSDDGLAEEGNSKPITMNNELYSFEVNSDDVPASPPPVYDNNVLYSLEQQLKMAANGDHSSC